MTVWLAPVFPPDVDSPLLAVPCRCGRFCHGGHKEKHHPFVSGAAVSTRASGAAVSDRVSGAAICDGRVKSGADGLFVGAKGRRSAPRGVGGAAAGAGGVRGRGALHEGVAGQSPVRLLPPGGGHPPTRERALSAFRRAGGQGGARRAQGLRGVGHLPAALLPGTAGRRGGRVGGPPRPRSPSSILLRDLLKKDDCRTGCEMKPSLLGRSRDF